MKRYEWEDKIDPENQESLWVPQQRDPREYPFGFFSSTDFVLASGGSFLWFEDPHEMLTWLKLGETKLWEFSDEDLPGILDPIERALAAYNTANPIFSQELMGPIQKGAKGYFCIDWWGNLDDLASGDTSFAIEARERFWKYEEKDNEGEARQPPPIPATRMDDFLAFLAEYGA